MKRIVILSIMLVLFLFTIYSFINEGNKQAQQTHQAKSKVEKNYQNYCAGCHGDNLEKFANKSWIEDDSHHSALKSIKNGIPEMGMPSFAAIFSEEEIIDLAKYVKKNIKPNQTKEATRQKIIQSEKLKFFVDTIVDGLDIPWGLEFLPNGDLLISERSGKLLRYSNGKIYGPIAGLPEIMAIGQGGLLDLKLHPDYETNQWIYISYSALKEKDPRRKGNTAIMRTRLVNDKLIDKEVIYQGEPYTNKGHHWGSKLAFDNNGYLYFGNGDRGQRDDFPQNLDSDNGKIHRIHDDGSIPTDNPFANDPNGRNTIYSYGHRNPQGTCVNPLTGDIWETEHGPRGGDEINIIKPGQNYGWPVISYGINYNGTKFTDITEKEGMKQPVFQWTPSIAPCGMTFLDSNIYDDWKYNLFVGSLRFKYIERLEIENDQVVHREKLLEGIGRVRNVVQGPDGFLYVAIESPGKILKLVPIAE